MKISIVMPCLNEAKTLKLCIGRAKEGLSRAGFSFGDDSEIIVADNESTDDSREIAKHTGANVVSVSPKGYGVAVMGGIKKAKGELVIIGDADGSYDFGNIVSIIEKLLDGYDLVVGNRFSGNIEKGAMPFLNRYLGNPVLSRIGRLLYGNPCGDFHCGLRGFKRQEILNLDLQSSGMELASEMIIKAVLKKLRITEVPIKFYLDKRGEPSHLRRWKDGLRHLVLILRLRFFR